MKDIPAFPIQGHSTRNGQGFQLVMADGMTLRDYFAAKAMQTLLRTSNGVVGVNKYEYRVAETAFAIADAMLKAREA